jgi:hypothetical protein
MKNIVRQKDTNAWIVQVWLSFIIAVSATVAGIIYLPVDNWIKGYMGMGLVFTIGSSFTLAKTIRDQKESGQIMARVEEARVEKLLAENSPLK